MEIESRPAFLYARNEEPNEVSLPGLYTSKIGIIEILIL